MIGIFITARLGSTRLYQKHLIEIEGKPMIKWLVDRYMIGFQNEIQDQKIKIFITTSKNKENHLFETIFENSNIEVFYGADSNIPLRHLQCAKANSIDYILSVDGDDILCSIDASKLVIKKLLETGNLVKTIGLPLGMNVMGYSTFFLEKSLNNNSIEKLETGWGKIFEEKDIITIEIENNLNCENIRMTLDYNEDVLFFKNVFTGIGSEINTISDSELVKNIINNNWCKANENLNDTYWENFNEQKKAEK
jgi:spore coat polysaccharide biosynthesis protein SpsF (cytidylyltransferase family)